MGTLPNDILCLLNPHDVRAPVDQQSIMAICQRDCLGTLPSEYVEFINYSNGYTGFVGDMFYLDLWPIETVRARNQSYQTDEWAQGFLLIGSDGGGEAVAIDLESAGTQVCLVPFIVLSRDDAIYAPEGFFGFLKTASKGGIFG